MKEDETGFLISDLFSMLTEIVWNEITTPNLFVKILSYAKSLYGSDIVGGKAPQHDSIQQYLLHYMVVSCPMNHKEAMRDIKQIISDDSIVEEFFNKYMKYDKQTRLVSVQPQVLEKCKKSQDFHHDLVWYNAGLSGPYNDKLLEKFPSVDCLKSREPQSYLNKRINENIYNIETLEQLVSIGKEALELNQWEKMVASFLKFVLLNITSSRYKSTVGNKLKNLIDGPLSKLLSEFEKSEQVSPWVDSARSRINEIKRKYMNEEVCDMLESKNTNVSKQIQENRLKELKIKFESKKNKRLDKMRKRMKDFFYGLEINSDKIIVELNSRESNIHCNVTGEKLDPGSTYYQFCETHHFNVILSSHRPSNSLR